MGALLDGFRKAMGMRLGPNEIKLGSFKQFEVRWFWDRIAILTH